MQRLLYLRLTFLIAFFISLAIMLIPITGFATSRVNGDFSLTLKVNGVDISNSEVRTITIDPEKDLVIDLHFFDVTRDIILEDLSLTITLIGVPLYTFETDLGSHSIRAGEEHREIETISPQAILKPKNITITAGKYRVLVELNYFADGAEKTWPLPVDVKIPGKPWETAAGVAAIILTIPAVLGVPMVVSSMTTPSLKAGSPAPMNTLMKPSRMLLDYASDRLEPITRKRVIATFTEEAGKRIVKKRCPLCSTPLKWDHCYTCKKSAKEVRNEYKEKVKDLTSQAAMLFAKGEALTLDKLCSELSISDKLGTDVMAVLKKAKLVKVRGLARKLMRSAIMLGISWGICMILWISISGFAVLSTSMLIAILAIAIIVPLIITKIMQRRTRIAIKKLSG